MPLTYATSDSDRRRGLRIAQTRSVKLFHPAANRYIPAQTLDLSPSGLRLTLPSSSPVAPGSLIQVHVATPTSSPLASKHAMTPARVVWVDRSQAKLQVGVEFLVAASNAAVTAA